MGRLTDSDRLDAFIRELEATYLAPPDEATRARHLSAIAEGIRHRSSAPTATASRHFRRNGMPRFITSSAKLAAAALTALLATAGLAVAGVDLPDPADEAFQKVGLSLPNQDGPGTAGNHDGPAAQDSPAQRVRSQDSSLEGCEFGQAVADSVEADEAADPKPCSEGSEAGAQGTPKGSRQTGESHSQRGQSTAGAAPKGSQDTGEDASAEGRSNAPTAVPQGGSEIGESHSQAGQTESGAGQQTGQEHAEQGQGTGDEASGGRKP